MICYKDMTFCSSDCKNEECPRRWDDQKKRNAEKWWGKPNPPVAFSDFSRHCSDYEY